jgi:hypothetical protein
VNQLLMKMSMAGITAASTTPSAKRIAMSAGMLRTMPVSAAHPPHSTRLTNTSLRTLRRSA